MDRTRIQISKDKIAAFCRSHGIRRLAFFGSVLRQDFQSNTGAEGEFDNLFVRTEDVPSPTNPKSSYMAALSAIGRLQRITACLVVGT
jgi:hypothetical protein